MGDVESTQKGSQQAFPVWCGLTLTNWLRLLKQKPTIERAFWKRVALVSTASVMNSVLGAFESLLFARQVRRHRLSHPPVFILGHWRSGTTLLHDLLSRDDQFAYPNFFQCSFPGHFLLTERWLAPLTRRFLPKSRPTDSMKLGWESPAEEEVAMLLMTLLSPYLLSAFPDRPEQFENLRRGIDAQHLPSWKQQFCHFLKKVSLRFDRPLLLKSPTNTLRLPLLLELFPDARFIHVVRNPFAVYASTVHLHRVLCRDNSFTSIEPQNLQERVLSTYLAMYHSYHMHRARIPAENRFEVRFEDLEADPVGQLQKLYTHLRFPGGDSIEARLADHLIGHHSYRKNEFSLTLEERRSVAERWKPAFVRYEYPLEETTHSAVSVD